FALRVHGTSASLYVELWGGDTGVALSGSDDGGWHHYCLTYDGSGWVLYFDGSQAATATAALDTGSDRPLQIGRFDSDYYLDGSIDEVYVYASALDEASIQVLYDAGSTAAPTAAPTTAPTTALLAAGVRYSFDAVAGASVPEASGEPALAGTIVGEHALAVGVDGGGAVDLSGGHVEFPAEVTSGVLGSAPRTLCLWALRRGGGALASYGGDDDGPTGSAFGLGFTGDAFETWFRGDTRTHVAVVAGEGAWHHYCLAFGAAEGATLYFDGDVAGAHAPAEPLVTLDDEPLRVGAWTKAGYEFDGVVDGFELHEVALGPARVRALYESTTAVMPPSAAPSSAPTIAPTIAPTAAPSTSPTPAPTIAPTAAPTAAPTTAPTTALLAAGVRYSFDAVAGASVPEASGEPALAGTIVGEHALAVGVDGGGAVDLSGGHVEFPAEVTSGVLGSAPRTLCLWALRRGGGALASYGGDDDGPTGSAFGLGFTGDAFETWFR
ncbi:hypothetical protein AURANDRAFT_69312, partial [Aureococcus anophagefferens]